MGGPTTQTASATRAGTAAPAGTATRAATATVGAAAGTGQARQDSLTLPGRIGARRNVLQMVTVTSPSWSSTVGTLKAWQRPPDGRWHVMHGPLPVRLGYAGWVIAKDRVQSSGTSPAGRFTLPAAFGLSPDPGTALPYNRVDGNDWWPYEPRDPATYNIYQFHKHSETSWRADYSEHLASYPSQYAYAIVAGFNLPSGVHYSPKHHQLVARHPADTHIGGGIFLHVRGSGATAGCIAMVQTHVQWLLRWLRPGKHPQVVMGPYDYVLTL